MYFSEKTTDFKGITAKKGTLKRKKQLREFVEHYNDGYGDDLYNSTPYRKQDTKKVGTCYHHLSIILCLAHL